MRSVRRERTGPEEALAAALAARGLAPDRHPRGVLGTPDFAFLEAKVVVFVDGDFWHGRTRELPKTNTTWWADKFRRNRARDRRQARALVAAGWVVVRMWETGLRPGRHAADVARVVASPGPPRVVRWGAGGRKGRRVRTCLSSTTSCS